MESSVPRTSFWHKPPEILAFGFLSALFGILLTIASLAFAPIAYQYQGGNLWPFVSITGFAMLVSGIGFADGRKWGYAGSMLAYIIAYAAAIVQAFQKMFAWGIFLEPVVLVFLIVPRVRSYFFNSQPVDAVLPSEVPLSSTLADAATSSVASPTTDKKDFLKTLKKPSNVLTLIVMLGILLVTPAVAVTVHTVNVTEVNVNIIYPSSAGSQQNFFPWFGYSPKTISGGLFTWGAGKLAVNLDLWNFGLFQPHTINSIRMITPGFTLLYSGLGGPLTLSDNSGVTFHMILQAPDYDYSGPVVLEIQTV